MNCLICDRATVQPMCVDCAQSYEAMAQKDKSPLAAIAWAAERSKTHTPTGVGCRHCGPRAAKIKRLEADLTSVMGGRPGNLLDVGSEELSRG